MAINHGSLSARLTPEKTLRGTVQTATIAYESDYERLTNKPSINNVEVVGDLSLNDLGIVNNVQPDWEQDNAEAEDYIKNKPEIPDAQIQSDWGQTDVDAKDFIKNKPEIPSAQVQSDWNEADNTKADFIKNKPTIPPEQVNSDWNAVSGKAQILNKPPIPSVVANPGNTTGSLTSIGIDGTNYTVSGGGGGGAVNDVKVNETSVVDPQGVANIDLTGYATTSDIPTDLADLQDDSTHRLVTDTEKTTWNGKSDFSGSYIDLTDKPTLGTASALDVASSGDASTSEVVKGNDTRLTDSRNAKDVYSWAKESTKPTYAYSEIQNTPTLGTASTKDYVNSVVDGSSDLVTSDAVHDYVDSAISGVYKASGNKTCAELLPALLIASNLGNVYNMTDSGVTTSDFVEGAGKTIEIGDNVVIVDVGTQNNATYKFDLLSGMVDLSNYIQKSATSGLMKNDGSVDTNSYATTSQIPDITGKADKVTDAVDGNFAGLDSNGNLTDSGHKHSDYLTQHQDISGKADKVTGATNGNLAKLDANGNLADGGWASDKTTTSISGNPISISGLKSNQLAVNPVITFEPIQAGSGTPSPSNIRAISGYDKIEVLSCGKNLACELVAQQGYNMTITRNGDNVTFSSNDRGGAYITSRLKAGTTYILNYTVVSGSFNQVRLYSDLNATTNLGTITPNVAFTPSQDGYIRFWVTLASPTVVISNLQLEKAESATTYEEPHKTTDILESLGQTVYGGTLDVRSGLFTKTWGYIASYAGETLPSEWISDRDEYVSGTTPTTGAEVAYKLASADYTTIQLTPHEISLLKDYAYVSTNGTNIQFDYHNGELASLGDVAQLSETVEKLTEYIKGLINNA